MMQRSDSCFSLTVTNGNAEFLSNLKLYLQRRLGEASWKQAVLTSPICTFVYESQCHVQSVSFIWVFSPTYYSKHVKYKYKYLIRILPWGHIRICGLSLFLVFVLTSIVNCIVLCCAISCFAYWSVYHIFSRTFHILNILKAKTLLRTLRQNGNQFGSSSMRGIQILALPVKMRAVSKFITGNVSHGKFFSYVCPHGTVIHLDWLQDQSIDNIIQGSPV